METLTLILNLKEVFITVPYKHDSPYMTNTLRKAIMKRSQLQSNYFKTKTQKDYAHFKNKYIFVVNFRKKRKEK